VIRYVVAVSYGAKGGQSAYGPFFTTGAAQRFIDTLDRVDAQILPLNDPEVKPKAEPAEVAEVEHLTDGGRPITEWEATPLPSLPLSLEQAVSAVNEAFRRVRLNRREG
jgi:hypothetical protein